MKFDINNRFLYKLTKQQQQTATIIDQSTNQFSRENYNFHEIQLKKRIKIY